VPQATAHHRATTHAASAAVLAVLLALVAGLLTATPAQARIYDAVVVDDPSREVEGARFPDIVRVKFHHDITDGREYFIAKFQLNKDVRWRGFRTAGFKANRYSITTNALETRYRVHLRKPDGTQYVCKRCRVRVSERRKRIVFVLPWRRIGAPAHVRMSASYVSAGYVMDTASAPYRALY
jgi:hypothetical protein